jgi:hypothetical protein
MAMGAHEGAPEVEKDEEMHATGEVQELVGKQGKDHCCL